jgi:hypothetical protein
MGGPGRWGARLAVLVEEGRAMALFVIERSFAEQLQLDQEGIDTVEAYNSDANLRWLFSFLSADKKKTYCLYEAPDAGALFKQAEDLGLPANAVIEVSELNPQMFSGRSVTGHVTS